MSHGAELADYNGVFALFRNGGVTVSYPTEWEERIGDLLEDDGCLQSRENFIAALGPVAARVIGPAYIGYAREIGPVDGGARSLEAEDAAALDRLRGNCDPTEWDHGGSTIDQSVSGVFVDGELVAAAGYEIWGRSIAHISIVTHPDFRGRGHGRAAVAHVAHRAISAGLLAQYRTLEANTPSIQIAESLEFSNYGSSVAVRLE